jgi:hypothetical protein
MESRYVAAIILVILLVLIVMYHISVSEGFANNESKALAIVKWFHSNPNPSYSKYRSDMESKSNIVEYEDARRLFGTKNFTVGSVLSTL